jgi:hypothetical protein
MMYIVNSVFLISQKQKNRISILRVSYIPTRVSSSKVVCIEVLQRYEFWVTFVARETAKRNVSTEEQI